MSGRVDFYVNSNKGFNGAHLPAELAGFAMHHGLRALSVADHDTVPANPDASDEGRRAGVDVIPAI